MRRATRPWTGVPDYPSIMSAVSATIGVICAASVRAAGGRTSCKRQVTSSTAIQVGHNSLGERCRAGGAAVSYPADAVCVSLLVPADGMSAAGSSSGKSAGRPAGSATVTVPSSAGSQSQRVRVAAACPRPSAVTSAQHARSRPCPSPSPVHRRVPTQRRTWAPGQSPATSRTPRPRPAAPPRGAFLSGLWPARVGGPGRSHSRPAATPPPAARRGRDPGPAGSARRPGRGRRRPAPQPRAVPAIPHHAPAADAPAARARHSRPNSATATTDPRASPPRGSNSRSAGSTGRLPELRAPEGSGHPSGDSIEADTADMVPVECWF